MDYIVFLYVLLIVLLLFMIIIAKSKASIWVGIFGIFVLCWMILNNIKIYSPSISFEEAVKIGEKLGVDWEKTPKEWWHKGMIVELEHGTEMGGKTNLTNNEPMMTGQIALAHILELPDYYQRLEKMEEKK